MDRTIKFRGIRLDNKQWVIGDLTTPDIVGVKDYACICDGYGVHVIEPTTIGQYTGMLDRDGVEIFEGDCVDAREGIGPGVIEWGNGSWIARCESRAYTQLFDTFAARELTVAGNVHQEPQHADRDATN